MSSAIKDALDALNAACAAADIAAKVTFRSGPDPCIDDAVPEDRLRDLAYKIDATVSAGTPVMGKVYDRMLLVRHRLMVSAVGPWRTPTVEERRAILEGIARELGGAA